MTCRFLLITLVSVVLWLKGIAQDSTRVQVWLKTYDEKSIKIRVFPPQQKSNWTYLIPSIIPGTYLKVNYHRFYDSMKAFDANGKQVRIKQADNKYEISGAQLSYIEYTVSQSFGNKRIWDNAFGCSGTIFNEQAYLINFQLVNGYFEGFQDAPFEVTFYKEEDLFGASSMTRLSTSENKDVFISPNYASLIDQPILYAKPDTASFVIDGHRFNVAVHSENGFKSAKELVPGLTRTMKDVKELTGLTSQEDYYFLFYFVGLNKFSSPASRFGLGSALEHKNSSVYYYTDNPYYDPDFNDLKGIVAHEYLHTIAPLKLHSEKIRNFNFSEPDMSQHIWLYEGVTDYLATLANTDKDTLLLEYLTAAIKTSEARSTQSMIASSLSIAENNKSNFDQKIKELGNFYQKGKLIAFAMDMELLSRTNGTRRLVDLIADLSENFSESPFKDDSLRFELARLTYPGFDDFYTSYIQGSDLVPVEKYFQQLGWEYKEAGESAKTFCSNMDAPFSFDRGFYYVQEIGDNSLGLRNGDQILKINKVAADLKFAHKNGLFLDFNSLRFNIPSLEVEVLRDGEKLILNGGQSIEYQLDSPRIVLSKFISEEQTAFRLIYFEK
jgi:predicted metalloprotease with PDZ domain